MKCECVCGAGENISAYGSSVGGVMYHMAHSAAAAIPCKNKGMFMSSLADLVFINVLPHSLPLGDSPPPH